MSRSTIGTTSSNDWMVSPPLGAMANIDRWRSGGAGEWRDHRQDLRPSEVPGRRRRRQRARGQRRRVTVGVEQGHVGVGRWGMRSYRAVTGPGQVKGATLGQTAVKGVPTQICVGSSGLSRDFWQSGVPALGLGLLAIGTSGGRRDFRRRKLQKLPSSSSPCHMEQKYDGHIMFTCY